MSQKSKILYVDDEVGYRKSFIRQMRKESDFEYELAIDGMDALEKLKIFPADLVVTDLLMPNMDGMELFDKVKKLYPDTLVIFITGSGTIESAIWALKMGAFDYIQKPFDFNQAKRIIKNAIGHKRLLKDLRVARKRVKLLGHLVERADYVMIMVADSKGALIEANAMARDMFGLSKESAISQSIVPFFLLDGNEAWDEIVSTVNSKSHWRGELTALSKEGTQVPVEFGATVGQGEHGNGEHIICFIRDITIEKEADRMKSEFISVASHEMRTPLTSIKNSVDLLLSGKTGDINDNQERFLSIAKKNIDRLADLINKLLDLRKMESGKLELSIGQMDIEDCVANVVNTFAALAEEKKISLKTSIEFKSPAMEADSDRIAEVLLNLVSNALKFTPENGVIEIAVNEKNGQSQANGGGEKAGVQFAVNDTGAGIPPECIDHVFDKFYQAHSALSAQKKAGSGLGLAICKHTIEAHGGQIWCASEEGKGSTFSFTLPLGLTKEN